MVQSAAGTKVSRRRCSVPFLEILMKTLADAFEHTLQDVYFAEHAITKALPKVINAVSNADLKTALKDHLTETKGQIMAVPARFCNRSLEGRLTFEYSTG